MYIMLLINIHGLPKILEVLIDFSRFVEIVYR